MGKRKANPIFASWIAFVKEMQHKHGVSYKKAMSIAKKNKSQWKRGKKGGSGDPVPSNQVSGSESSGAPAPVQATSSLGGTDLAANSTKMSGGRTRRHRRGGRRCGTRRHRR